MEVSDGALGHDLNGSFQTIFTRAVTHPKITAGEW